jgi:aromatic ring-opening dioxygenase catalytic subunit (LigB family)
MPILGDPSHDQIVESLREKVPKILKLGTPDAPRAIVLVTAHWSEQTPTISSAAKHALYYDYYNFPQAAYELEYDAPGSPEVAALVHEAMRNEGLEPALDAQRGWDHGVFIPMLLVRPAADTPIVQVSVLASEDPSRHFRMGRALSALREQNIAVVGSGFASLHNLKLMFSPQGLADPAFRSRNAAWSDAVTAAISTADPDRRRKSLEAWRTWPGAYEMHPPGGAGHFLPLIVCAGAAGAEKAGFYSDVYRGVDMYSYYWE